MATQQQLLALAKQGNPKAIARLITNSLKGQGITAKANIKGDCLWVMLESAQVPDSSVVVPFIRRGMIKLGGASIKTVKIYGKQTDASAPAWSKDIDLGGKSNSCASPPPKPESQIISSTKVSRQLTSPVHKAQSSQPVHAFQYSFFASCMIFMGMISLSAIVWFVLIAILWKVSLLVTVTLSGILCTVARIFYSNSRVVVSLTGIKVTDDWGKHYFVEWSSITTVRHYNLLGFRYLLVSSTQSPRTLWLPLFLANMLRFKRIVSEYAGAEHLLTEMLLGKSNNKLVLEKINGQIKAGWLAACVVGVGICFFVLLSLLNSGFDSLIGLESLIDVVLIFGLAFGIYKKSRIAAVIMFIYYVVSRIYIWLEFGQLSISSIPIIIVFIGCFVEGIRGTFAYHRLMQSKNYSSSR
ncbi:MAG: hypothetical protein F6J92_30415 [Symploca sp. SIO1A3]|nr:hypothetical protein [Symploca sp. SIO1A3]